MADYLATAALAALLATGAQAATPATTPAGATSTAAVGTRYVQASSGSSLNFTFTQLGAESAGSFKTFATEFTYDPAKPAQGALLVRVMIDSLDTQDEERDSTLKTADLFDAKSYPAATYLARKLERNASGALEAVGKLTIRGVSKDLRLPLTVTPTPKGLELSGQTSIRRLDFGIGQGEWKSTDSVGDEVKIQYMVALVRAPE